MRVDQSENPEPARPYRWVIAGLAVAVAIAGYYWGNRSSGPSESKAAAPDQKASAAVGTANAFIVVTPKNADVFVAGPPARTYANDALGRASWVSEWALQHCPTGYIPVPRVTKQETGEFVLRDYPVGRYPVRVEKSGFTTFNGELVVEIGRPTLKIVLLPSEGSVAITGLEGAEVWSGVKRVGTVPAKIEKVPAGPVHYTVRAKGYTAREVAGTVAEGEELKLNAEMEKASTTIPNEADAWKIGSLGLKLVWISPGTITTPIAHKGHKARDYPEDYDTGTFEIEGFWLGQYEVTQSEWQRVMPTNPSRRKGVDYPVESITWKDALAFCAKITERERAAGRLPAGLEYTLPTVAESQYARLAGVKLNPETPGDLGATTWHADNSGGTTHPVGKKQPNAWGLYDMFGNVGEWCDDEDDIQSKAIEGGDCRTRPLLMVKAVPAELCRTWHDVLPTAGFRVALKRIRKGTASGAGAATDSATVATQTTGNAVIRFTSSPAGAEVFAGAKPVGLTPCEIGNLPAGTHQFQVKLRNYKTAAESVEVKAGETATRHTILAKYVGPNPGNAWTIPDHDLILMWIRPGQFAMGDARALGASSRKTAVTLTKGLWLGRVEITQKQWARVMGTNPSKFEGESRPVDGITWFQAMQFCERLNASELKAGRLPDGYKYTLPTEAQWEYACRAGREDDVQPASLDLVAWVAHNSKSETHPVGSKRDNGFGLKDMQGNVSEWCRDWHDTYHPESAVDPSGPPVGERRVYRGANYSTRSEACRSAARYSLPPEKGDAEIGFRLALAPISENPERPDPVVDGKQYIGPKKGNIIRLPELKITLLWLQPMQPFTMGRTEEPSSSFERGVYVSIDKGYWLGTTEVTQSQWEAVMGSNPSEHKGSDLPVESVSWSDAMRFCQRINEAERTAGRLPPNYVYSLPDEMQWEYACRGGMTYDALTTDHVRVGESNPLAVKRPGGQLGDVAWFNANSGSQTHPVGRKKANDYGFKDMYGNVSEWCLDYYHPNVSQPWNLRASEVGPDRVYRGSSYSDPYRENVSWRKYHAGPDTKSGHVGLRLALIPVAP